MDDKDQRLVFRREGDSGMAVEVVGDQQTLSNMLASALMGHSEVRQLLMPVFMKLMQDQDFMMVCMEDMMHAISPKDKDDDTLTTD
jgi:hypothetical protein